MFAAWGALEWALASVAGIDVFHGLTEWFKPGHAVPLSERLTDWKLWAALGAAAFVLLVVWRELKPKRGRS